MCGNTYTLWYTSDNHDIGELRCNSVQDSFCSVSFKKNLQLSLRWYSALQILLVGTTTFNGCL